MVPVNKICEKIYWKFYSVGPIKGSLQEKRRYSLDAMKSFTFCSQPKSLKKKKSLISKLLSIPLTPKVSHPKGWERTAIYNVCILHQKATLYCFTCQENIKETAGLARTERAEMYYKCQHWLWVMKLGNISNSGRKTRLEWRQGDGSHV